MLLHAFAVPMLCSQGAVINQLSCVGGLRQLVIFRRPSEAHSQPTTSKCSKTKQDKNEEKEQCLHLFFKNFLSLN